jgi:hypothetical protein
MLLYMALAPESKLSAPHCDSNALPRPPCPPLAYACPLARAAYKEGGPAAEARFEAGVAGFEARAFRGCGVFTSEPFEVSDDSDSVQMLTRSSQIGEFYIMMPPQVKPTGGAGSNLHTADMLIYDEESDKHVRITWRQALAATLAAVKTVGDDKPVLGNPGVSKGHSGTLELSTWITLAEAVAKYSSGKDEAGTTVTVADTAWQTLSDSGALDIRIVVARPFIEHLMVRCSSPFAPLPARASDPSTAVRRSTTSSSRCRAARRARRSSARRTCS